VEGRTARMEVMRNLLKILLGKPTRKSVFWRRRCRTKDNIYTNSKALVMSMCETSVSLQFGKSLDQTSNHKRWKKASEPCTYLATEPKGLLTCS
jgi:hypothetical protein